MSTKAEPGPFDGLERAQPDEPVFTLRAHDILAAPLVHQWVLQRREAIARTEYADEAKRELELTQVRDAEEIAWAMLDWRNGVEKIKAPKQQTYSGNTMSADELAAKKEFDDRLAASRSLDNAISFVTEIAGFQVEHVITAMRVLSKDIRPQRASYAHRSAQ